MKTPGNICCACGYRHLTLPQLSASGGASHEICPSCGFEPGFTDDEQGHTFEQWRAQWVAKGMAWFSSGKPRPDDWNPMRDLHALLGRKRPVLPAIRIKRAEELRQRAREQSTQENPKPH
jgi:hypothetical protein